MGYSHYCLYVLECGSSSSSTFVVRGPLRCLLHGRERESLPEPKRVPHAPGRIEGLAEHVKREKVPSSWTRMARLRSVEEDVTPASLLSSDLPLWWHLEPFFFPFHHSVSRHRPPFPLGRKFEVAWQAVQSAPLDALPLPH